MAASSPKPKRSPLTPSTITPPSIERLHSHNSRTEGMRKVDATSILSKVASRPTSPRRVSPTQTGDRPLPAHEERPSSGYRRRSWEDCERQHGGYISFPDFDTEQAATQDDVNRE